MVNYHYDELLDGRQWYMRRGRDFTEPPDRVVRRLRSAAAARECTVQIDRSDPRFIGVKAAPKATVQSDTDAGGVA